MLPFREHHLITLLEEYGQSHKPLDRCMADYFRAHKALGSKDRAYVAETAWDIIRWQGLIDAHLSAPYTWEKRLKVHETLNKEDTSSFPDHVRLSCPKFLYDLFCESWGEAKAQEISRISNTQAPLTVRANLLKTTRTELLKTWANKYDVAPCFQSPTGIKFSKREPLTSIDEFKKGFFEIQDEGSQLVANLVDARPGEHILDFCCGSGGKTLAFAPNMNKQGQIYLHDIRPYVLDEAKLRLKRAGVQNAQFVLPNSQQLRRLKKKCDWVLVDAPCTGTGTLRRNPDIKWRLDEKALQGLVGQQRTIFEQALSYLKPGGKIVYTTCSVLKPENHGQIDHFMKAYELKLCAEPLQIFPTEGEMDGFFGAVLSKN